MTRKIKCVNPWKPQAQRMYMIDGLAKALSANGGGQGAKTGLYLVSDMDKKVIDKNFTKLEGGKYVTSTRDKKNCYAVTTRPRNRPLSKKQDNYVLEEKTVRLRESTRKGYKDVKVGDGIELSRSHCNIRRGVSHEDATGTLNTQEGSWGTLDKDYRIRKLTPRECERLQAFPDDWTKYGKNGELISDTQRYKCCGNAVTTTVITAIVDEMFDKVKK